MFDNFLIFPNQLFKIDRLPESKKYYLIEENVYFGDRIEKLNFNKLKLVLHRATMKYYSDYLKNKDKTIKYLEYPITINDYKKILKKNKNIGCFDVVDRLLNDKLTKINSNIHFLNTPNFITNTEDLNIYYKENENKSRKFFHMNFYEWQKKLHDIIPTIKSKDKYNRKKLPKDIEIPGIQKLTDEDLEYIEEAKKYINKKFPNNIGNIENFIFPVTHKTSERWFNYFLNNKLKYFGTYQDAIDENNNFLFHSLISPVLNIGLLDPLEVCKKTEEYYKENKSVGINNVEGFIRQIIGWREYSRYLYIYAYDEMVNSNHFNNRKTLSKKWYDGTIGVLPIDNTINNAFNSGYLHHIERLMMMSNFMNLCEIKPYEVYKWFMEFSCDSYDWVMINNVYSMGLFADGGLTMTKPYISSYNYIIGMSNYKKGEWCDIWKMLYYGFLIKNKEKLEKTFLARNLSIINKLSKNQQNKILEDVNDYLKKI